MERTTGGAVAHLVGSALVGALVFAVPLPWGDRLTVLLDLVVTTLRKGAPSAVAVLCLGMLLVGAVQTLRRAPGFQAGPVLSAARIGGLLVAVAFVAPVEVPWLHDPEVRPLMWHVLAASVALIVPLGASVLEVLVGYGVLDGIGTLMRPLMRPLFRLPGRAALDDLMSWLGSYSVGLYLTRRLVDQGAYTRREAYLIVTAFSTVSIGFVGVVCATLDLLGHFPLVFGVYFVVVYLLAAVQARVWPVTRVPDVPVGPALPAEAVTGGLWATAREAALQTARTAPSVPVLLRRGFVDGAMLASRILGTILTVGTGALLLAHHTPLFAWLGAPLVPVLRLLAVPDAEQVAPAVVAGITEMYIPALLVQDASEPARFFVAVLSISQLVFFSSVGPMILEMFRDLPVRVHELVGVFVLRTVMLVPLLAAVTHGLVALGVLVP